jgi:predicted nucleic acid-binding protein
VVIYSESNFVLELALGQEQAEAARYLLRTAENRELELAIPVFSLCEPYSAVRQKAADRRKAIGETERAARELARAPEHAGAVSELGPLLNYVIEASKADMDGLEHTIGALLECANVLPMTKEALDASLIHQREHGLQPADALIYAIVLNDAAARVEEPKMFVTRNSRDFDLPSIRDQLDRVRCDLLFDFRAVRGRLGG